MRRYRDIDAAVAALNRLEATYKSDDEAIRLESDKILLAFVPPEIARAYRALWERVSSER